MKTPFNMALSFWYKIIRRCGFRRKYLKTIITMFTFAFLGIVMLTSQRICDKKVNVLWKSQIMAKIIGGQGRLHIQDLQTYNGLSSHEVSSYIMTSETRESIRTLVEECQKFKEGNTCNFMEKKGEKLLTLFTTWTYKEDKFPVNNRTLYNWKKLSSVHLVVFADTNDTKVTNYSRDAGWNVLKISKHASGAPVLSSMFLDAMQTYRSKFYGYANGDILFTDDLTETLKQIYCKMKTKNASIDDSSGLLIVGRRMNVPMLEVNDKTAVSWPKLRKVSYQSGKLFRPDAEDYFITDSSYPWKTVVPVVVGRVGVDNWIVAYSRLLNVTTIDATESILAVHQTVETRGNFESKDSGRYNIDLINTLKLPIVYAWGMTDCTQFKCWFDLCGRLFIKRRKVFAAGCSSSTS